MDHQLQLVRQSAAVKDPADLCCLCCGSGNISYFTWMFKLFICTSLTHARSHKMETSRHDAVTVRLPPLKVCTACFTCSSTLKVQHNKHICQKRGFSQTTLTATAAKA